MPDTDYANDGSMETPADAGKGPPGAGIVTLTLSVKKSPKY
jgi:hypothetical protein